MNVVRKRHGNVWKKWQKAINLTDVVRRLIENYCSFTQKGIQDGFLCSN